MRTQNATVVVRPDGSSTLAVEGLAPWSPATSTGIDHSRHQILERARAYAASQDVALSVHATEPDGIHRFTITPTGELNDYGREDTPAPAIHELSHPTQHTPRGAAAPTSPATPTRGEYSGGIDPVDPPWADRRPPMRHENPPESSAPAASPHGPQRSDQTARSFLAPQTDKRPADHGWRGMLTRLGMRMAPGPAERAERADVAAVSRHWPGPRTIVVLNGKGGANKTPSTILLAALFARHGSGAVAAVDGNVTRGTLGWRTEQGPHENTVLDMLPHLQELRSPTARQGDISQFLHHQTRDQFDVLRSNPLLVSTQQKLTPAQLDDVHATLMRYYRLLVFDTGNDEGDSLWLSIVGHADQIVLSTTTRAEHAEAARLLLNDLAGRDEAGARLAHNAAVIVSQADRNEAGARSVAEGFTGLARGVATIPYDPRMRDEWLHLEALHPTTQRAWLRAAALVAQGL